MHDWRSVSVSADMQIISALEVMDRCALGVVLVVDDEDHLLGIVTDGDIRRALLKHVDMQLPIKEVMTSTPQVASSLESAEVIIARLKSLSLKHMPVINEQKKVVDFNILDEMLLPKAHENWVILMAGGLGSRLHPLTKDTPKPLLKIADKPILQIIIESFVKNGFRHFYICVNYKSEMIEEYFGNGEKFSANIRYIKETKRLGTVGALSLLPEAPRLPVLVMNSDLVAGVDFSRLLKFHQARSVKATMCVREYGFELPYGVVCTDNHIITKIDEKPYMNYFINAGIYVLEPSVLSLMPDNEYFDMTMLFDAMLESNIPTAAFPLREYWLDVGRKEDYDRAEGEYQYYLRGKNDGN
jgi:dTDP-glucose pyrophosphorylase/predicted transcriptional regulator